MQERGRSACAPIRLDDTSAVLLKATGVSGGLADGTRSW